MMGCDQNSLYINEFLVILFYFIELYTVIPKHFVFIYKFV